MVSIYLEWHGHEVWTELSNGPHNGETFQFYSGVGLFSLVEQSRSATDDALLAFAPRPAVDASLYSRKDWLKSEKALMGLVVRSVLRRSKASWQSVLQWKTASFLVRAYRGPVMPAKSFTYRR